MMCSTYSRWRISSRSAGPMRSACISRLLLILRLRPVMMLSITLMPLNSARFWKVRAHAHLGHLARVHVVKRLAPEGDGPSDGVYTPLMQLSMELLPAPLGPMIADLVLF